jgi:hypothetical protein
MPRGGNSDGLLNFLRSLLSRNCFTHKKRFGQLLDELGALHLNFLRDGFLAPNFGANFLENFVRVETRVGIADLGSMLTFLKIFSRQKFVRV